MNKLDLLNKEISQYELTLNELSVVVAVYQKPFIGISEISTVTGIDRVIVTNALRKMATSNPKLVDTLNNQFVTTCDFDDMIGNASEIWFKHNNPDHVTGQRPITKKMDDFKDYLMSKFDEGYFSNVKIFRQNYQLILSDKKAGVKNIEIRNNGDVRVAVSKVKTNVCNLMMDISGVTFVPPSATSYISNYDYACSYEKLDEIINTIKSL